MATPLIVSVGRVNITQVKILIVQSPRCLYLIQGGYDIAFLVILKYKNVFNEGKPGLFSFETYSIKYSYKKVLTYYIILDSKKVKIQLFSAHC